MTDLDGEKERYITYELGLLSRQAALSTRDRKSPVYAKGVKEHQKGPAKDAVLAVLKDNRTTYLAGGISEEDHIAYIEQTATKLSSSIGKYLHNGRFRIGVAQKLVNVHLKYLWTAGLIREPPHCPIDGIIRDIAKINYDWIVSDSIKEYREAIAGLKSEAGSASLSVWELVNFRRRGDR